MAANPYDVLGVKKDASQKDIQRAYRQLAKKSHPDLHPGDPDAEHKFKDLTAAYELIGDADKRKRFDAGEIDVSGQETPKRSYYRDFAGSGAGAGADATGTTGALAAAEPSSRVGGTTTVAMIPPAGLSWSRTVTPRRAASWPAT